MNPDTQLLGLRGCLIDAPEFGKLRSWKDGAIVIDVGINRVTQPDGTKKTVGDVQFEGVREKAPSASGVYMIYTAERWVYVGGSDDIRQSLVRRDPTSEPIAFIETRSPGGDWIRTLDD